MTPGQALDVSASVFAGVSGLVFMVSYALAARWWRSLEGRLMMISSMAISCTCLLTVGISATGHDWLRITQAFIIVVVGTCFIYYTILVWRVQWRGRTK